MALNFGDLKLIQKALTEVRAMGPAIGVRWTHHDLDVESFQNQGWFWLREIFSQEQLACHIDVYRYGITTHAETFEPKHAKTVMAGLWLQRAFAQNKNHSYNSKVFSMAVRCLTWQLTTHENSNKFADLRYPFFALLHVNIPFTFIARLLDAFPQVEHAGGPAKDRQHLTQVLEMVRHSSHGESRLVFHGSTNGYSISKLNRI